jgi:hypothetical protein
MAMEAQASHELNANVLLVRDYFAQRIAHSIDHKFIMIVDLMINDRSSALKNSSSMDTLMITLATH